MLLMQGQERSQKLMSHIRQFIKSVLLMGVWASIEWDNEIGRR